MNTESPLLYEIGRSAADPVRLDRHRAHGELVTSPLIDAGLPALDARPRAVGLGAVRLRAVRLRAVRLPSFGVASYGVASWFAGRVASVWTRRAPAAATVPCGCC